MANSVVHFEIFASDVERARKFYERVFGWSFEVGGPPDFYLISTGDAKDPGLTQGLIAKRRGPAAEGSLNAFRVTISVRSIDDATAAIEAAGGKLRSSVVLVPDVGKVAEFADTEGNIACVIEHEKNHRFAAR
ncbi:MAG TPA: VOC family protein [Gammaproteobacteria bacterium]|nr:VOC family protein [Gammaproteobacteria bacterium]